MRERYLLSEVKAWQALAIELDYDEIALHYIEQEGRKLVAVQQAIANIDKIKISDNGITDEMIARAKEYPVDQLIDFARGKARAFCHDDNNPSMYHGTRTNNAVCPVCDKKFDSIGILMVRDGMTFIDAVKELSQ